MGGRRTAAVVGGLVVVVALVASSCVLSGSWTTTVVDRSPEIADVPFFDVSCPSTDFCMAIGAIDDQPPFGEFVPAVIETWDGSTWSPLVFTPDYDTNYYDGFAVTVVSCGTPTSCMVAWNHVDGPTQEGGRFSAWDGESWVDVPWTEEQQDLDPASRVIACAPDGSRADAAHWASTTTWDGESFTTYPLSPSMITPDLEDLSCLAIDDCVGLDDDHSIRWDGSGWTTDPWWGFELPGRDQGASYHSIDCSATDVCVAVGFRNVVSGPVTPVAAVGDGTTWSAAPVPLDAGSLADVSCSNTAACVAIGATTSSQPVAFVWNGGTWYRISDPPGTPSFYRAIGCGGTACMAVGGATDADVGPPLASRYAWPP